MCRDLERIVELDKTMFFNFVRVTIASQLIRQIFTIFNPKRVGFFFTLFSIEKIPYKSSN